MIDNRKIMDSITPDYRKQKNVNGVYLDTFFFRNMNDYKDPITMLNPLSYAETQTRGNYAFYEASFDISRKEPLLIFVEKFFVSREPVKLEKLPSDPRDQRDNYYLVRKKIDQIILEKEVALNDTFGVTEYIHLVLNEKGEYTKLELCRKEFDWPLEYIYDDKGLLIRIITKTADRGEFVQERGKDF